MDWVNDFAQSKAITPDKADECGCTQIVRNEDPALARLSPVDPNNDGKPVMCRCPPEADGTVKKGYDGSWTGPHGDIKDRTCKDDPYFDPRYGPVHGRHNQRMRPPLAGYQGIIGWSGGRSIPLHLFAPLHLNRDNAGREKLEATSSLQPATSCTTLQTINLLARFRTLTCRDGSDRTVFDRLFTAAAGPVMR